MCLSLFRYVLTLVTPVLVEDIRCFSKYKLDYIHTTCVPLQNLLCDLELTTLSTDKLILKFQSDLVAQCKEGKNLGTLTVSVAYLRHRKAVEVTVISAAGLPGLDKSGIIFLL